MSGRALDSSCIDNCTGYTSELIQCPICNQYYYFNMGHQCPGYQFSTDYYHTTYTPPLFYTTYFCTECETWFVKDMNYKFCPYCGEKIDG